MKRSLAALSVSLVMLAAACGGDDGGPAASRSTSPTPHGDVPVVAVDFCRNLSANAGTAQAIRPIPFHLDRETMLQSVTTTLNAMGDLTPPDARIAKKWKSLRAFYRTHRATITRLDKGAKLPAKRQAELEKKMKSAFDRDGSDVINYVLHTCDS